MPKKFNNKPLATKTPILVPKSPKKRRVSFTPLCYGMIGLLVENPNAVFALTQQRIAERMEKNGWLERRIIELPQTAGAYTYVAKFLNFVPTEEGLAKWQELNNLVGAANLDDVKKATRGEKVKQQLKKKLKSDQQP